MTRIDLVTLLAAALATAIPALAPARPFGDHMVLPMDRPIPIWGQARPGAKVEIRFAGHVASGRADAKGNWKIELPAQKSSAEGRDLEIISNNHHVVLRDVLVGEVWLCSGQSNMDFPLAKAVGGKQEEALAGDFPTIRLMNLTDADVWNERLISDHVQGWRKALAQPELPFLMVQLPRIGGNDPLRRGWPQFRAVQAAVAEKLPHVSLIETVDLGWDSPDVHPPDKRPVGERLGKAANQPHIFP